MKKIIFAAAAVLLLAAGCGKSASVQSNTSITTQGSDQPAGVQSNQTSLKALMMAGRPQKCMVTYSVNNNATQGTIYLANGKMRGDFTSQVNGTSQTSHMINDGTTVYSWVDGMAMAMKMSATAPQSTSTPSASHSQSIDPNANEQYDCSIWNSDSSVFTPPASINFMDESQMMKTMTPPAKTGATPTAVSGGASASAGIKAQECAACNNAGAGKAQCLAALSCN